MGNTNYPTACGDFDERGNIAEYKISIGDFNIWEGTSKDELSRQLLPCVRKFIKFCRDNPTSGRGLGKYFYIKRFFGPSILQRENWDDSKITENCDYYSVYFSESGDYDVKIIATRIQKGKRVISKDWYHSKHKSYEEAGNAIIHAIQGKTF